MKGSARASASTPSNENELPHDDAPYLLDATRLIWRRWRGRHPTGIDRVALAYLRHFGPRAQAVVQHDRLRRILDVTASQRLFELLTLPGEGFKSALIRGALVNVTHLTARGRGRPYLNVGHTGLNSAGFRQWVTGANVRPVYLVHDLIPITHPQFCRPGEDARHRERMVTVLRTAAGVVANSQATLDEISSFAQSEGLPLPPALAAPLAIDPLPQPKEHRAPERATFVALGTIEARKNHMLLLKIWQRLIDRFGSKAPRLLIIGGRGWEAQPVFDALDGCEKLRDHVLELNGCSDQELADHLASASALLFPSRAEGYGLPLIEALASGVPVIASDLPVFRESGGEIPLYLNPEDEPEWEAAIIDYAGPNSPARAAQLDKMRGFRPPDWNSHFDQLERWIAQLS